MSYQVQHEQKHMRKRRFLSLPVQLTAVLVMVGVVLYTLLFSTYPPIHDAVHEFRHSLMFIPCH
jgi:cobalt transporter subunit CbtB